MLKPGLKLGALILLSLTLAPVQALIRLTMTGRVVYVIPQLWHKTMCGVFGIKIIQSGTRITDRPVQYTSNHVSYLDIVALGSVIPASFLAKSEVAGWPGFGILAKLQNTIFIERKPQKLEQARRTMGDFLKKGGCLIVFAEGTSTSGVSVKPFKPGMFSVPGAEDITIQPVTISILRVDGKTPQNIDDMNKYAWPLEMETPMPVHLAAFAATKGAHIKITFHAAIEPSSHGHDRKALAKAAHESVSMGLELPPALGSCPPKERK